MDDLSTKIGETIKDSSGKELGKLLGVTSDVKGHVSNVTVELAHGDFVNIPSTRLTMRNNSPMVLQDSIVEAEEISRELDLLRRRDRALIELRASSDIDELTYDRLKDQYGQAKDELLKKSETVIDKLAERVKQLDEQIKTVQSLIANNKMQYTSGEINENVYCNANESIQGALKRFNFERDELLGKINVLISSRDSAEVPVQQPYEEKELPNIEPDSRDSAEVPVQQPYEEKVLPNIEPVESTSVAPQKVDIKPTEVTENSNGLTKVQNPRDIVVVRMEP
jgi:chromosome segregation ATPase